jgi:hypothetical protein
MESEVRSSMPDLPPTSEIARLARSPSALLNHLSAMSDEEETPDGSVKPPAANGTAEAAAGVAGAGGGGAGAGTGAAGGEGSGSNGEQVAGVGDTGGPTRAPSDDGDTVAPGTNGHTPAAQPTEVALPADPTLN